MNEETQNVEVANETTTENVETQTTEQIEVKTFTEEEVNTIVQERLKKAKKNMPSQEELDEYHSWKESQKTPSEIQEELNSKINSLESNNNSLEQDNMILRKGIVDVDDLDYIKYKVSKMEGDFKENLDNYLNDNPKFLQKETPTITTGISQNTTGKIKSSEEEYLDKKYANNPYYKGNAKK